MPLQAEKLDKSAGGGFLVRNHILVVTIVTAQHAQIGNSILNHKQGFLLLRLWSAQPGSLA